MTEKRDCANLFLIVEPDEGVEADEINALRSALEHAAESYNVKGLRAAALDYVAAACASADCAGLTRDCWTGVCTASGGAVSHKVDKDADECQYVLNYGMRMQSKHSALSLQMRLYLLVLLDAFGCSHALLQFLANAAFDALNKLPEDQRRAAIKMDADTFTAGEAQVKKMVDRCVAPLIGDASGGQLWQPPPPAVDKSLFEWPDEE